MSQNAVPFVIGGLFFLSACGSVEEPPVEQIVVHEPGEIVATVSPANTMVAGNLIAAGEVAFATCSACHSVDASGASNIGPNLNGVMGREAAVLEDYKYSEALTNSNIIWDENALDAFIANPDGKVPGTKMTVGAVADDQRRRAIIAYLSSLDD